MGSRFVIEQDWGDSRRDEAHLYIQDLLDLGIGISVLKLYDTYFPNGVKQEPVRMAELIHVHSKVMAYHDPESGRHASDIKDEHLGSKGNVTLPEQRKRQEANIVIQNKQSRSRAKLPNQARRF